MERIHKIPVTFARSVTRKVKVEVDKLIDFELTTIRPIRCRNSGSAQVETVVSVGLTGLILLGITIAVMLVANG